MSGGCFVESYTTPVVGQNLAEDRIWQSSKSARRIVKIGFTGGSAVYDGQIEVFYGQEKVINIYNNSTAATPQIKPLALWNSTNKRCRANGDINVEVVTATGSHDYYLFVDIREG